MTTFSLLKLPIPNVKHGWSLQWSSQAPSMLDFQSMRTFPDAETTSKFLMTMQCQQGKNISSIQVEIPNNSQFFLPVTAARYWTDIHNIMKTVQLAEMAKQWLLSRDLKWNDEVYSLPTSATISTDVAGDSILQ
jgi:hypothetical protein